MPSVVEFTNESFDSFLIVSFSPVILAFYAMNGPASRTYIDSILKTYSPENYECSLFY